MGTDTHIGGDSDTAAYKEEHRTEKAPSSSVGQRAGATFQQRVYCRAGKDGGQVRGNVSSPDSR